jgi:hypothetical protein
MAKNITVRLPLGQGGRPRPDPQALRREDKRPGGGELS